MSLRAILLGAAASVWLYGPGLAQSADSAGSPTDHVAKRHQHHANGVETRLDRMERLIEEQQAEIRDLKAEVGHPGAIGGASSAAAAAIPPMPSTAQPQVSPAQFQALQNQVDQEATAAQTTNKAGWWNNTKISGRMYYDITNLDNKNDNVSSPENGTNFDIKRFYLGVEHQFDDVFSADLTTDFTYDSGVGASQLYIKKAYLQANVWDWLTVRLGSADMPWVPYVENAYGYRYIENTLIDRTKYGTSADWGAHILGTFLDGLLNYQISAVNGAGYKKIPIGTANRSEGIDVEGRVGLAYDGLQLAVGGYDGQLGKDVTGVTTYHTATRFDALADYTFEQFQAGVEYFHENDFLSVTSPTSDDANGYSAFASWKFVQQWSVFGRYDWVRPKNATNTQFTDNYYNVGISYSPTKIVDFALVYKHDRGTNGDINTSNGLIGGLTDLPGSNGTYDEVGLWGQVRW
jgi:hypothetical protein